jgi:UDPglucose 6-dehydrogenase
LAQISGNHDYDFKIIKAVLDVNQRQRTFMVEKIEKALGGFEGKRVAVLGLSFKPNTDDMREAPSQSIIEALQKGGATIVASDPVAIEEAKKVLVDVEYASDPYAAAEGADAIILITEWNPFRNLDLEKIKMRLKAPIFIDLRNVYEPKRMAEKGFHYTSVGRPSHPAV